MARTQPRTVLLVEDDQRLCDLLTGFLKQHAVEAVVVGDLATARQLIQSHRFDAILLDLTLGGEDASQILTEMRQAPRTPILVVSARIDEADRVLGLELGADDYLTKPFSPRELLARLRAVWRRVAKDSDTGVARARFAGWQLDAEGRHLIDSEGLSVDLTAGEYELLRVFLRYPQRVLSRQDLLHHTQHTGGEAFDRSVDVLVARLRRKLRDNPERPACLETIRGSGYRFIAAVTWDGGTQRR